MDVSQLSATETSGEATLTEAKLSTLYTVWYVCVVKRMIIKHAYTWNEHDDCLPGSFEMFVYIVAANIAWSEMNITILTYRT